MTLVVGKIIDEKIHIHSDSKVNDRDSAHNDPLCGVLKTVILHPKLALSFAGKIVFAEEFISKFYTYESPTLEQLIQLIFQTHTESNQETDFVISTYVSNKPLLIKISEGKIESGLTSVWIGDKPAFNQFQQNRLKAIQLGTKENEATSVAFFDVINNPKFDSVDDFHISVVPILHKEELMFVYNEVTRAVSSRKKTIELTTEYKRISLFGDASTGDFHISYLASMTMAKPGIAFYFPNGNFGLLYIPVLSLKPAKISNVNGEEFVSIVKSKYGVALRGLIQVDDYTTKVIDTR